MIIFLHGPDTYRSRAKLREFVGMYRGKYGSGLAESTIYAPQDGFGAFWDRFGDRSLFAPKRLIVVERALESKDFLRDLGAKKNRAVISDDAQAFIVFWDEALAGSVKESSVIEKLAEKKQEFSFLRGPAFRAWVLKLAQSHGVSFEPKALALFSQWREGDSWQAANDIQKLRAYIGGGTIKQFDVEMLTPPPQQVQIFSTIDSLFAGEVKNSLSQIEGHIKAGDDPLYLLAMIARQMRIVAAVKSQTESVALSTSIARFPQPSSGQAGQVKTSSNKKGFLAGVHPFVLRKTSPLARRISWESARELVRAVHETDVSIKQGALDPQLGVELLVLRVAKSFAL